MIWDGIIISYILLTLLCLRNEISLLPAPNKVAYNILNFKISNLLSFSLIFCLLILFPFISCFTIMCFYRQKKFTLKFTLIKRYKNLITMMYYSTLINIAFCLFDYLESLSSSKTYYYIYRLSHLKGNCGQGLVIIYKNFMTLYINGIVLTVLFFLCETYIAKIGNNISISYESFLYKNIKIIPLIIIWLIFNTGNILEFFIRYYKFTQRFSIIDETNFFSDFLGSIMINLLLSVYLYVKRFIADE